MNKSNDIFKEELEKAEPPKKNDFDLNKDMPEPPKINTSQPQNDKTKLIINTYGNLEPNTKKKVLQVLIDNDVAFDFKKGLF
jgi:hypothetical protein